IGAGEPRERAVHIVSREPGLGILASALALLHQRPCPDASRVGLLLTQPQLLAQPHAQKLGHLAREAVANRQYGARRLLETGALPQVGAARPVDQTHRNAVASAQLVDAALHD